METNPCPKLRWLRLTPDRAVLGLLALEGFLLLSGRFGWFTFDRHKGYAMLLTIAAVGAALLLMLFWFLIALVFRRRFQFSLRSLMLLVVVVAIPCSWFATAMKAARRQGTVEAIRKLGGKVVYDYEMEGTDPLGILSTPSRLAWLRDSLVVDLLADVTRIEPAHHGNDDWEIDDSGLKYLKGFTQLQELELGGTKVTNVGLKHLKGLSNLKFLNLAGTKIRGFGLEHLNELDQLRYLDVNWSKVKDAGLKHIKGLTRLEVLILGFNEVSNEGLVHINGLTQLRELYINCPIVSDAGLIHLKGLKQLKVLNLDGTKVSDAGLRTPQRIDPT